MRGLLVIDYHCSYVKVRFELKNSPLKACGWHTRPTTTQKDGPAGGRCLTHHEGRPAAASSPKMRGICVGRPGCQSGGEKAAGRPQLSTEWGAGGWGLWRGGAGDGEIGSGGGGWGAMAAGEYGIDAPVAGLSTSIDSSPSPSRPVHALSMKAPGKLVG